MLKAISITLPEKMIQEIDEMLFDKNFASRSDFFRHLVRMWKHEMISGKSNSDPPAPKGSEEDDVFANVDCEYGIPPHIIEAIKEKAKSII